MIDVHDRNFPDIQAFSFEIGGQNRTGPQAVEVCDVEMPRRYNVPRVERCGMGKFMGYGIAIGVGIGAAVGAATDDMGTWVASGVALGVAIGYGMSRAKKKPN